MNILEIQKKISEIKNRLDEVNNLFNIYNINDEESITSFREELNSYKEILKKISNEELNGTSK
jgi:hypothetical protein